jgi:dihydrofolate reductase
MTKVSVFNSVSLDGYFTDPGGDMSWAHKNDPEWTKFSTDNAQGTDGAFLFGRKTYELMKSFWPTEQARQQMPQIAHTMNAKQKIVFSKTVKDATWQNTRLVHGSPVEEVHKLKQGNAPDLLVMGSGTIIAQLAEADLIDDYTIIVCSLVLGAGRTMFEGVKRKIPLKLTRSRSFANGNVVNWYERA